MLIPVKYNVRNLRVRWVNTLMTVLSTALVVWASVLTFGLVDGLIHALIISGDEMDLIVMRKGSTEETSSSIDAAVAREIATLPGIATAEGKPMCAAEFVTILTKPRRNNGGTVNLIVRGVQPESRLLRPNFRIVRGRDFKPGVNEIITSEAMARRFENLAIGEKLEINKVFFQVVGYFESAGSSAESEVWTNLADLTGARRQPTAVSIVNLRAANEASKKTLLNRLRTDEQFNLNAVDEPEYYMQQMTASIALLVVGVAIAVFLMVGSMFAAANTMFAAVASRGREIGTLRAIGFRRSSILASFMLESLLLSVMGGALGCLFTIPFNGLSTGTANWATFSEITFTFRLGAIALLVAVIMIALIGSVGGLFPAIRAVRIPIITALRET